MGDLVPADGLVLESQEAMVDETVLTGEPFPVEKLAASSGRGSEGADTALFGGTSIVAGEVRMRGEPAKPFRVARRAEDPAERVVQAAGAVMRGA